MPPLAPGVNPVRDVRRLACYPRAMSKAPVVAVSRAAAAAVRRGHPWVLHEPTPGRRTGDVVSVGHGGEIAGWGLVDEGDITVRVLGTGKPPARPLGEVVAQRVLAAEALRRGVYGDDTDCWRVVNGEGDGLGGLVVDRYGDVLVLRVYGAAWLPHLDVVVAALVALPGVRSVLRRFGVRRVDDDDGAELLAGPPVPDALVVREHGMKMLVRPYVGQKTGLFLDQREHRAQVRQLARGRVTANLFAYNGGFSVAAALGGATRVTTVDVAADAVEDARENFRLNGLDPDAHAFDVADAFAWAPPAPVDLLVVDPPSLTRGARSDETAARAYEKLHAGLANHVARGGLLVTSSCTARLTLEQWRDAVRSGLSHQGTWAWHGVSTHPVDHPVAFGHPEGWYLKAAILRRL
jgi:23S rRNA (cytosine1962-C5)-methyltransferase